jgi:RNA recognition motif-containing protein
MKVYVGNLSKNTTDAEFTALARQFGTPESATVVKDRGTGQSRGFGFIEYKNAEEAKAAIAGLNGKEVGGQVLKVNESQPKGGTRLAPAREMA